jgi:hypothetical protein
MSFDVADRVMMSGQEAVEPLDHFGLYNSSSTADLGKG